MILVHGAWHGPWAWAESSSASTAEGIRTRRPRSCRARARDAALGDLHDDAEVVRAAVAAADGPALVVAHSYGGLPVSEGLAAARTSPT